MAELGEIISPPSLDREYKMNCPFDQQTTTGTKSPTEQPADDDLELQENDGGVLGENLEGKKPGDGTHGPFPPDDYLFEQKANDSTFGDKKLIRLDEYDDAEAGDFPFTVAAHHLIPGNASLYHEDSKLVNYMEDGGCVKSVAGKKYTIKGHIGYDVNGSHNGVWLPGNYAIKKAKPKRKRKDGSIVSAQVGTTPVEGMSWSALAEAGYEDWQYQYVAGACKATGAQFHDSHDEPYSKSVRKNLLKIVTALNSHLDNQCPDCKDKKKELPPPYRIKNRLYALSETLRGYVTGTPQEWKGPWFTSQRWSEKFFEDGKVSEEFLKMYAKVKVVKV